MDSHWRILQALKSIIMQIIAIIRLACQQLHRNRQPNLSIQTANAPEFEWKALENTKTANQSRNKKTSYASQQSAPKPQTLFKLYKNQVPKLSPLQTKLRLALNSISLIMLAVVTSLKIKYRCLARLSLRRTCSKRQRQHACPHQTKLRW